MPSKEPQTHLEKHERFVRECRGLAKVYDETVIFVCANGDGIDDNTSYITGGTSSPEEGISHRMIMRLTKALIDLQVQMLGQTIQAIEIPGIPTEMLSEFGPHGLMTELIKNHKNEDPDYVKEQAKY